MSKKEPNILITSKTSVQLYYYAW